MYYFYIVHIGHCNNVFSPRLKVKQLKGLCHYVSNYATLDEKNPKGHIILFEKKRVINTITEAASEAIARPRNRTAVSSYS